MILPTKGIPPHRALISLGADILRILSETKTVSRLWDELRKAPAVPADVTFDWFVLSLDLLYLLGAVELERNGVRPCSPPTPEKGTPS
jgi:hypothetical protein